MADIVSPEVRSRMMAGIRGTNTRPELIVRKGLHARGIRFRLHDRRLPGRPDLVLPKYQAVIFVHGCFWHMHECHLFKWPSTRKEWWGRKLRRTREIDGRNVDALLASGWRVLEIWECALKGRYRRPTDEVIDRICSWIRSSRLKGSISGRDTSNV